MSDRTIWVHSSGRMRVTPPNYQARSTGLALGITGTALIPVGLTTAYVGAMMSLGCDETTWDSEDGYSSESASCGGDGVITAGLVMMAVGAVLTPIGWVMFGKNRRPRVELSSYATRTSFQLGPTLVGNGYCLGAMARF
jgi:hypothetical protein